MVDYTKEEINQMMLEIDSMSQYNMAYKWRFSQSGDPYFRSDLPLYAKFESRFKALGGMTPKISKHLG